MTSRVWLVTGCSQGLGRQIAMRALDSGDRVVATARDADTLIDLAAAFPDRVLRCTLDVTNPDDAYRAVAAAQEAFGRVDVLVNNAGFATFGALEELSLQALHRSFNTIVFGAAHLARAVLPVMREQRSGHIVQISSVAGQVADPGFGAYVGAKFALEGMSDALALEVAPFGIKVTIIEPGGLRTNASQAVVRSTAPLEVYRQVTAGTERFLFQADGTQNGDPERAAEAIVNLVQSPTTPPARLALGSDAVDRMRDRLMSQLADLAEWEVTSRSIDV